MFRPSNSRLNIVRVLLLQFNNGDEAGTDSIIARYVRVLEKSLEHVNVLSQPTQLRIRDRHRYPTLIWVTIAVVHVDDAFLHEQVVRSCPRHVDVTGLREAGNKLSVYTV